MSEQNVTARCARSLAVAERGHRGAATYDPVGDALTVARTLLDSGLCAPAYHRGIHVLQDWRAHHRATSPAPGLLAGVLTLFALCDRRTAVLDVLRQHTVLLPACGEPGRDHGVAILITAISDARSRAHRRPHCQYRIRGRTPYWSTVRAWIQHLEYSRVLPHPSPKQGNARHPGKDLR